MPGKKRQKTNSSKGGRSSPAKKKAEEKPFFPVKAIHEYMESNLPGKTVDPQAAIFLTGVIEYLAAEIMELTINCRRSKSKGKASARVTAEDVDEAIESDPDLMLLMERVREATGK